MNSGAQVMPAAKPNRRAALRARLRSLSPKCEEVRHVASAATSVDDVYVRLPTLTRGVS